MRDEIRDSQIPPSLVVQEWARSIGNNNNSNINCNFFETASDVPNLRKLNSEDKNVMIFYDLLLEKQNKCECYYNIVTWTAFTFCKTILNYLDKLSEKMPTLFAFPQDLKNINHIYNDHVGEDMAKESLQNFVASVGKNRTVSLSSI